MENNEFDKDKLPAHVTNKWRIIKDENIGFRNLDTHYTWDTCLENMKKHFYNYTTKIIRVPIKELECPNNDAAYQRSTLTGRQLLERSQLPRAVMMSTFEVNRDQLQAIPSMQQMYRVNSGMHITVFRITEKDYLKTCPEYPQNQLRDFNFTLQANLALTNATIFYTILLESRPMTTEVAKQLRREFPDRDPRDFFYGVKYENDKMYGRRVNIPYNLRSVIPDDIITRLLKLFRFSDNEEGCIKLLNVLRRHSNYKIDYTIDGGTRRRVFTFEYPSQITWITETIDDGIVDQENNVATYGVKMEGVVHYIEFPLFKLMSSYNMPNVCNPESYDYPQLNKNPNKSYHPFFLSVLSQNIKGTTIWDTYTMEYDESDEVKDETGKRLYMKLDIKNLTNDWMLNEYIDYVLDDWKILDREKYFNIEVRHTTALKTWDLENKIGNDHGITVNYENKLIIDELSEPGDSVYIAVYVNKQRFHEYKIDKGYQDRGNLSDY